MPFKSKVHARFMFWKYPEIAKRWAEEYHSKEGQIHIKDLPERVSKEHNEEPKR